MAECEALKEQQQAGEPLKPPVLSKIRWMSGSTVGSRVWAQVFGGGGGGGVGVGVGSTSLGSGSSSDGCRAWAVMVVGPWDIEYFP